MPNDYFDFYRHLDEDDKIPFSMDQMASAVASMNYGPHRFICALSKAQKRRFPESELAIELEKVAKKFTT